MEFEGFIDIQNNSRKSGEHKVRMSIILKSVQQIQDQVVDLIHVTESLKNIGCVSRELYSKLLEVATQEPVTKQEQINSYLQLLMRKVPTDKVYAALCTSGCDFLFPLFVLQNYPYSLSVVRKVTVPFNKCAYNRYRFLKMCVDNKSFKINGNGLSDLRRKAVQKLHRSSTREECQKRLEEKVVIDLLLVQQFGVNDRDKRFEILQEMKDMCTQDLNRTSLELTHHSKMAVTYAKIGRPHEAKDHIRQTLVLCDTCEPCFATVMALNDVVYAYQELCYMDRSPELLERSTNHGQLMYHVQCCEDEAAMNQWKRIILLFMVMSCLHISHEFETGDIHAVNTGEIQEASIIISEVVKISQGIEIRREMVLKLCQGRLHEKKDQNIAVAYVQKAYDLSNDGCLRDTEKVNIERYLATLKGSL